MLSRNYFIRLLLFISLAVGSFKSADAQDQWTIDLERPGDREFILDLADLLTPEQEEQIRATADVLLTDKAAPIIVVTINSMNDHAAGIDSIESFAMLLFNQWGIGFAGEGGQKSWNYGILLVVSQGDRRARIELGADWGREKDRVCQQIMDDLIVAKFKQRDFGGGIVTGVNALDKMARGLEVPQPPKPQWYYPSMAILIGLTIFTAVSLYRRGASGWAWLFWGIVFTILFAILQALARGSSRGGGGYSGGSFGGGFSGGGGASGSW